MDTRKLQTYASLAEILSAVAIVVSLIYVASEFRRSSTMSSRDADVILFERIQDANRILVESPDLAEIVAAADQSPESLSDAGRLRYLTYQHNFFDSWEIAWNYHDDGILEEEVWQSWDEWFSLQARERPTFAWAENRQHFTSNDFRQHVDAILGTDGSEE